MAKEITQASLLLEVAPGPHIRQARSTATLMFLTCLCLLPIASWGVWIFGWRAAGYPLLLSMASALAAEGLVNLCSKRLTLFDGSALLSGLLLGLTLPPALPAYITVIANLFSILVVKWSFGGLGCNWMNPALAGRALVFFSFPKAMSNEWLAPQILALPDSFSSATPLMLTSLGFGDDLNNAPLSLMDGIGYLDLLFGRSNGSIGETPALLLIVMGMLMLGLRLISWHIPISYLASVACSAWLLGGLPYQQGWASGDVRFHLLSGGVMLVAFFMVTDPASSPLHRRGMLIYAALAGFLTVLFRIFGSYPEGAMLAVLLANCVSPLLDVLIADPIYGVRLRPWRQRIFSCYRPDNEAASKLAPQAAAKPPPKEATDDGSN